MLRKEQNELVTQTGPVPRAAKWSTIISFGIVL